MSEWVSVPVDGEEMRAYHATAPDASRAGVVVIQEIFGVNNALRTVADRLAAAGHSVLVPDLYWRLEPGVDLGYDETDRGKAFALMGKFDVDTGVEDVRRTVELLRSMPSCNGKVAVLGFCLGGTLAYLAAARAEVDAAVAYYGTAIHQHLDEVERIKCPLLLHFGSEDHFVPPAEAERIRAALAGRGDAALHVYPGVGHAFANVDRDVYDASAAELAFDRTRQFLGQLG